MKLTNDQQKTVIESLKQHGTYAMAAKAAGISTDTLRDYRKRNPSFNAKCEECLNVGKKTVGDNALTVIESIAFGKDSSEKGRLTAAAMLANWAVDGFRGVQRTEGRVEHNVHVVTNIPRPSYDAPIITLKPQDVKLLPPVDQKRAYLARYMRGYRARKKAEKKAAGKADITVS
jgi:hypothetical protein